MDGMLPSLLLYRVLQVHALQHNQLDQKDLVRLDFSSFGRDLIRLDQVLHFSFLAL